VCGLYVIVGWAGDTMNYSVSSQAGTASLSLNNSGDSSDMNSDTDENDSEVKNLNTT